MNVTEPQTEAKPPAPASPSALAELYAAHAPSAARFAYLLTGDRAQTEDLVQEAFIRVASRTLRVREAVAFRAYLRRTIINLHISQLRRRRVERTYLAQAQRRPILMPSMPDIETQDDLWRQLLLLPARQRAALVLRYYEDLSERETAEMLGCSRTAARSLTARALQALRSDLGGDSP